MNIAVLVYSRFRPKQMELLIRVLQGTQSRQHNVRYYVSCCPGDTETRDMIMSMDGVSGIMRPADDMLLGAAINHGLKRIYDSFNPDIFVPMADDVIPQSPGWDRIIASYDNPMFCWRELNDPHNTTFINFNRSYYEALRCMPVPETFPFWFVDTWQAEVYHLAFGRPMTQCRELILAGKRGKTQGLRDVAFWFKYFAATRPLRMEQAVTVCNHLKKAIPDYTNALWDFERFDATQIARSPQYESMFGNPTSEPEPSYIRAYEAAKAHMAKWVK